jgi:hypothetical protein
MTQIEMQEIENRLRQAKQIQTDIDICDKCITVLSSGNGTNSHKVREFFKYVDQRGSSDIYDIVHLILVKGIGEIKVERQKQLEKV